MGCIFTSGNPNAPKDSLRVMEKGESAGKGESFPADYKSYAFPPAGFAVRCNKAGVSRQAGQCEKIRAGASRQPALRRVLKPKPAL